MVNFVKILTQIGPIGLWRSHWGGKGGRVPSLTTKKSPKIGKKEKNQEKSGKNRGKKGKIGKKRQKSGSFFHFAPPDR